MSGGVGTVSGKLVFQTAEWERGLSSSRASFGRWGAKAKQIMFDSASASDKFKFKLAELNAMAKKFGLTEQQVAFQTAKLRTQFLGIPKATGMARLAKGAGTLRTKFNAATTAVGGFRGMMVALGGVAVVGGIKATIDSIDKLGHTANKLGMTTEALGKLRYAAKLTGVAANTFDMGIQRMTRRLSEAARGTGEARGALGELSRFGLPDAATLARMSPDKAFGQIAEAMSKVRLQSDRVRLSFKLFDSEGVALVNTLKLGEKGLAAAGQEAARFGLAIDMMGVKRVQEARHALDRMSAAASGVFAEMTIAVSPYITLIGEDLVNAYKRAGNAAEDAGKKGKKGSKVGMFADVLATAGLGFKGARMLTTNFAANVTGATAAVTGDGRGLAESLRASSQGQYDDFMKAFIAKTPSERVAARAGRPGGFTAGVGNVSAADLSAFEETAEEAKKALTTMSRLRTEVAGFGQGRWFKELETLRAGDDPFMVEEAEKLVATLGKLEMKATQMQLGKSIFAATRTPMERFKADVADAIGLMNAGAISRMTFDRHVAGLQKSTATSMMGPASKSTALRFASADVYGSAAATSAIARAQAPGAGSMRDKASQERQETNRLLANTIAQLLRDIERGVQGITTPTPMDVPPR